MPACARKKIVRQGEPGIFHVSSRVVRRAFLLGSDPLTVRRWEGVKPSPSGETFRYTGSNGELPYIRAYAV